MRASCRAGTAIHLNKVGALAADFGIESFLATLHYVEESDTQHIREGLVKAGANDSLPAANDIAAQQSLVAARLVLRQPPA